MDSRKKNFESELPAGYEEVKIVDAASKKMTVWMNVAAIVLTLIILIPVYLILDPLSALGSDTDFPLIPYLIFIVTLFAYVVLHELTHGAAYKLLTGQKLTYGFTASVAFCGVPDIYVYRRASLISLLAPFVVFSIFFLVIAALLTDPFNKFLCLTVFAIHFGGCSGDLYDTLLYLFRFKDPTTLMRDTGPKQTFYVKK